MRIYKWELAKLLSAPTIWVFLVLCLAFNVMLIVSESYGTPDVNALSRTLADTGVSRYADGENIYTGYDTGAIADILVRTYQLHGGTESLMRAKYQKLQEIVTQNAEAGVGLDIYADGYTTFTVHKTLFKSTLFPLFTETGLFALLVALYTLGYEHQQRTEPIVYGTKTGRHITRAKRAAALSAAGGGFVLLAALTLAVYFFVWDFSGFWSANVQSANNIVFDEVGQRPFITWVSLNVAQYLAAVLALGFALSVVFCLIGFFVGLLTRNTYMGFVFTLVVCLALLASTLFCMNVGLHYGLLVLLFSPVSAWVTSGRWLTDMGGFGIVPFHETVAIAGNLILFALLSTLASWRFLRKDVL